MGDWLLPALAVLALITVLGHVIWITLAWLIRTLFGVPRQRPSDRPRRCPFCDRWTPESQNRCDWCGRDLRSLMAQELDDLLALARELRRLQQAKVLEAGEVDDLLARAKEYRGRLIETGLGARPAPAAPTLAPEPTVKTPTAAAPPKPAPQAPAEEIITLEIVEELPEARPVPKVAPSRPVEPEPPLRPAAAPEAAAAPRPAALEPEPVPPLQAEPRMPSRAEPPAVPKPPRKPWREVVSDFLEERNIQWAELLLLLAGLLIVGPSIALAISFREELEQIPLFKFFIFVGVTSAIFGIGLYTYHRWKLPQTGWMMMLIATLLVPLGFAIMVSLSKEQWTLLNVAWEGVSLGIFVYLVGWAARVLVSQGRWYQVGAVVGNSAVLLLMARLNAATLPVGLLLGAGCLPVAVFAAALGGFCYRTSDRRDLEPSHAAEIFTLLGTAVFAMAWALGLLVGRMAKAEGLSPTLDSTSVLFALAAVPILATGLTVVRGTSRDVSLGGYRTAGTMVALLAILVMVAAAGMAWPRPLYVIAVGIFNTAALVFVAFRYRVPVAHAGAIVSAAIVYLTGYHVLAGHLDLLPAGDPSRDMLQLAITAESGTALIGLFALLGVVADMLARRDHRRHAEWYAGGAAVVALVSLLMATAHGVLSKGDQALLAMVVYGIYAAGGLLLNARFRRPLITYLGLGLLAGATCWGLWWQTESLGPIWAAVLAAEALAMGAAAAVLHRLCDRPPGAAWNAPGPDSGRNKLIEVYRVPLLHAAEAVTVLALALGAWTAWTHRAEIDWTPVPVLAASLAAASYLLLAWGYRSAERTWVGSMVVMAGLLHTLLCNYTGRLDHPWLDALLAHASLAVVASLLLSVWIQYRPTLRLADDVRRVFVRPLGETALLSSTLALVALPLTPWQETSTLAACLAWLAALWLVIAWSNRWPALLSGGQAVLAAAVAMATTAWLQRHPWTPGAKVDLLDPRSLHVYGIGLGLLTLAWVAARIVLRRNAVAQRLLNPAWPAVDRFVGHAVVALQLVLVAVSLLPGFWDELYPGPRGLPALMSVANAFAPTAWLLAAVLTGALLVKLWERWREAEIASSMLLAATVPCLIAGQFLADRAAASALRWGLAVAMIVGAAATWQRHRLKQWCTRIGGVVDVGVGGPPTARTTLLATTAVPVLLLTLAAAAAQLSGTAPGGPLQGSFFDRMGPEISYLLPLVLVIGGLVGFALREASAGYAFSAGLVAKMAVVLGYLLRVTASGHTIGAAELATIVQLLAITASAWAVAWLIGRRWADVWREGPRPSAARTLMNLQWGIAATAAAVMLAPALVSLALFPPSAHEWTIAAGNWLGWLALASVVAAYAYRAIQAGRRPQPDLAGLAGMAALGLLACTIRGVGQLAPEWGYRTLMLGWGTYALFIVLATWWVAGLRTLPGAQGPSQALIRAAAVWVSIAGLLAVLLGLKAALLHDDPQDLLWAAAAIALASAASAAMSVWRRREGWAFAAAFGVNLAASLVVWHYHWELAFGKWWILLVQANVIATAAVALVWLAARRRLYELGELSIRTSPLLAVQTTLAVAGNVLILIPPVVALLGTPGSLPTWASQIAEPAGWIAWLLAAAAAAWYLRQVSPQSLFHVVGGAGLGLGVLIACAAGGQTGGALPDDWLSYHALMTAWASIGLAALGLGLLARNLRVTEQAASAAPPTDSAAERIFPGLVVQGWVTFIAAAAVAVALAHCHEDPGRPWWSARAILAASVTAGVLAMWLRLPGYVLISGLLVNVAGTVAWIAWGPWNWLALLHANVLCLAVASFVWTLIGRVHPQGTPTWRFQDRPVSFSHAAVQVGLIVLGALTVMSAVHNVAALAHPIADRLGWLALGAVAAALVICFWDRRTRFPLPGIYLTGLIAVGMALDARALAPRVFCWTAGHELAGFVLLCAVLGRLLPRMQPAWRALRVSTEPYGSGPEWFGQAQALVGSVLVLLSIWISIDFGFDQVSREALPWLAGRPAGPLAALVVLAAAALMAGGSAGRPRAAWQLATFGLATLALAEVGWAWLDPAWLQQAGASAWLHRNVILFVASAVTTFFAGFGLPRLLPDGSDWIGAGRRCVPALGGLALVMLVVVLAHEALLFERPDGTPTAMSAVVVVTAALVGLLVTCLGFALVARWDPFGLSDRGRTVYVYAAEALGGLIGVHLWLTVPKLFQLGIVDRYWMFLVMLVAFAGAGLSELFYRRGLRVLSEPLERTAVLLPLAPAIGFFFAPDAAQPLGLAGQSPAVWFLGAAFYGTLAATRRSIVLAGLSAVAGIVGLCVLWHQLDLRFAEHPQLWLIPIALVALVAEYLNRGQLTPALSTGVRYVSLSVIYVSSSVEFLVINKIGVSLMLPLILVLLSLLGILVGILLRIRSYIYLGFAFLLVVIVTMIWYAAVDQQHTWVLWICLISIGLAILGAYAVYEKHRAGVLEAFRQFRHWQG